MSVGRTAGASKKADTKLLSKPLPGALTNEVSLPVAAELQTAVSSSGTRFPPRRTLPTLLSQHPA
jgi:hypothetical protein